MKSIERILEQMNGIYKPQRKFMLAFISALFICSGRATMKNLSRYGTTSSRRIARWKARPFDFWDFNIKSLKQQNIIEEHRCVAAFDCTFIPKSGKSTHGLAKFYNSSASRAQKGLETGVIALLDTHENTAYSLLTTQTPAALPEGQTRTDFYTQTIQQNAHRIKKFTNILVVDGGLAKKKFIHGVQESGLQIVGKLRRDSKLRYIYKGPKRKGRGRPKQYDGYLDYTNPLKLGRLCLPEDELLLWNGIVNHPGLGQDIFVVLVQDYGKGYRGEYIVLYSTALSLSALEVYEYYKARFQIEFLFRDGKQHTGFTDGQMRDQAGLDFHMNSSLSAVNLLRLEDRKKQNIEGERVISLYSWKRRKYNEALMNRIFSECENLLPEEKKEIIYVKFRDFGAIAA